MKIYVLFKKRMTEASFWKCFYRYHLTWSTIHLRLFNIIFYLPYFQKGNLLVSWGIMVSYWFKKCMFWFFELYFFAFNLFLKFCRRTNTPGAIMVSSMSETRFNDKILINYRHVVWSMKAIENINKCFIPREWQRETSSEEIVSIKTTSSHAPKRFAFRLDNYSRDILQTVGPFIIIFYK